MTGNPRVVLSPSQASENLWAWHSLMRTSIESLTKQYNEEHSHFLANPMDTASQARLIKLRELMLRARAGETGAEA